MTNIWRAPMATRRAGALTLHLPRKGCHGSLMIEIAVVLVVMGILATISLSALRRSNQQEADARMQRMTDAAALAVRRFANVNGRLPCPDLAGTGYEGNAAGQCPASASTGALPWRALGLETFDTWPGVVARYGVFRASPEADLVVMTGTKSIQPLTQLAERAARAAVYAPVEGSNAAFIGDARAGGSGCNSVISTPAFVVAVGAPGAIGSGRCFLAPRSVDGSLASASRAEFVGYVQAKKRGG